ncbi:MAG: hypothetical protein A2600_08750 [Candidatus Lambdaproteobacteria bacterium RIFOXYD1_FULL_56_27]|uniref:HD-GYP domain-containing protein n=1 Tax=Candidatus Lambdaproteobacteria bacterium RIFOXYD2_FULL_56_26 TaxID=1817773 RepID=A0A1F6GYX6_9PROT|nr:MAG: hypothetical protein A2426_10170 [Candidatus Lambdaproteobacteria bacterium RIFOXYC1_FULL_56_13]OGH03376.1 MAG: hypothetical protein A2557_02515 [Candidatus Lambdaproteobacteria bacterium RIFOXYD2_FULL_56_26]OGH06619.1 MAG: hypothetical protein A2600_08750 [Candidatus Lambdaproteobacteria bacterium RIFOXYD1_FULL_56_27]
MSKQIQKLLASQNLASGMKVIAIVGFTDSYTPMGPQQADWIKLNFDKAVAKVRRTGEEVSLPVNQVKVSDHLLRLEHLELTGKDFVVHSGNFGEELESNGLTLVIAETEAKSDSAKEMVYREKVKTINRILEKIDLGRTLNHQATQELEHTFEAIRNEKVNLDTVNRQVDVILADHGLEVLKLISLLEQNDNAYQHSIELGAMFHSMYFDYIARIGVHPSGLSTRREVFLGAFVHDFGMAKVPKDIYESKDKFDKGSPEWNLIRQHPQEGAKMLEKIGMPPVIVNMALYHHVKFDSSLASSYPEKLLFKNASTESRLLSLLDVFQGLTGRRNYAKTWSPPAAMRFMEALVGSEFEEKSWSVFLGLMGKYPVGSLVRLSSGELAFVVSQSPNDASRPMVVPVVNKAGEELTHNQLILLETELYVEIVGDMQATEVFGDRTLEVFSSIQLA